MTILHCQAGYRVPHAGARSKVWSPPQRHCALASDAARRDPDIAQQPLVEGDQQPPLARPFDPDGNETRAGDGKARLRLRARCPALVRRPASYGTGGMSSITSSIRLLLRSPPIRTEDRSSASPDVTDLGRSVGRCAPAHGALYVRHERGDRHGRGAALVGDPARANQVRTCHQPQDREGARP
jgi:hypothetical protein